MDTISSIFGMAIWLAIYITAPILVTSFVAAILIGIIQAMAQIQEQTLSFAPKLAIVVVLLLLTYSATFNKIVDTIKEIVRMAPNMFIG